jgi:fermentation-respiration switch protein FrsA (DUF1100 family)
MNWLRALTRVKDILESSDRSRKPEDPLTGLKVADLLDLNPFSSVYQIARATNIPLLIVFDHLKGWDDIGRHAKWISSLYRGYEGVVSQVIQKGICNGEIGETS